MKLSMIVAITRKRMIEIAEELEHMAEECERTGEPVSGEVLSGSRYDDYLPRGSVNFNGTPYELRYFASLIRKDASE